MSAISNVGTSSSLIYLAVQSTRSASCDDPSMDATDGQSAAAGAASAASGSTAQQSPLSDLRSQIETAVTDSLSKLPAGSSPEDVFKAVRSAVEDTLKANGIDPQQVAGHHGGHHHHHAGGAASGGAAAADAASSTDADSDDDNQQATTDPLLAALQGTDNPADPLTAISATGATAGKATSQSTTALAFFATGPNAADALSTLVQQISGSANGQSSGQSKSSSPLLSALQNSSTGNLNLNDIFKQLFQSFPSGTGLDVQV